MRKNILMALLALLTAFQLLHAVPARPGKFTVTQPDGTCITLQQHGDEWGHWLSNDSGQMVRADEDGFYRVVPAAEADAIRQRMAERRQSRRQAQAQAQARARRAAPARANAPVAIGKKHFLVILVEFSNLSFTASEDPNTAFTNLMNEKGYSVNGATGSARDFYYDNSGGLFEPVFDVYGPVKLDNNYAYYGENDSNGSDKRPAQAVVQGCQKLDEEIDFSRYDNDGDGEVDLVFMYYAGRGEADGGASNTIWPHQWEISSATGRPLQLDGMRIDSYACTNELDWSRRLCGIGAACHEFGHAMGLPDFYDTDGGDNGSAGGLYSFSVMCNGTYNNDSRTPPYFNFEERMLLGWVDESAFLTFDKTGTYTIPAVTSNTAYRTFTDMEGEYFVYETRVNSGWDAYLPGFGMIVYHVDKSDNLVLNGLTARALWDGWRYTNSINAIGNHPCFYVVPAANQSSLYYAREDRMPFPYTQGSVYSYAPTSWSGEVGPVTFSDIVFNDRAVSLRALVSTGEMDFVTIADAGSYRAGDRFTFELVRPEEVEAPVSVDWYYDDEPAGADSVTLTAGIHTVDARLTYANGRQAVVSLEITVQ